MRDCSAAREHGCWAGGGGEHAEYAYAGMMCSASVCGGCENGVLGVVSVQSKANSAVRANQCMLRHTSVGEVLDPDWGAKGLLAAGV